MSLKVRMPARLKVLFPGVALSKKSIDAVTEKLSVGLTDESTDDEIDAKLNARNEVYSFDDQRKFDDYQAGKAKKEADDKEAKRLADIAAGKKPEDVELPADTPEWAKAFMKTQKEETEALKAQLASVQGDRVANTRRDQFIASMKGTSEDYQKRELKKFDRIAFKDDEDFTSFLEDTKEDHAAAVQDEANGGLGGDRPTGGAGGGSASAKGEASQPELDEAFKNFKL